MAQSADDLIAAALALPAEERERMLDALSDSLDDGDIDEEFAAVLTRRAEELESGAVQGIPIEEVKARAEKRLAQMEAARKKAL